MELLSSSVLPEAEEGSEGEEEASVLDKGSQESAGPEVFLFPKTVISSPISRAGGGDWPKTQVVATWLCMVTSSGSPFPLTREPRDVAFSVWEGSALPSDPELDGK